MSRRRLVATVAASVLIVPLGLSAAQAAPGDEPPDSAAVPLVHTQGLTLPSRTGVAPVSPALADAEGQVTAFVQIDAPSGLETVQAGGDKADVAAAADTVEGIADDVVPADAGDAAPEVPAKVDVTTMVVPGVVVTGDAERVRALADRPDVAAVYLVVPKTVDNKGTDAFTRAQAAWQSAGVTGQGMTIAVIDTGLDYTHADFGGPGTTAAYDQAYGTDGTGPIPAGLFDPAKFLGGYDFAGPLYDAGGKEPGSTKTPTPDANPIDAPSTSGNGGHGSHVAGTAAGFGVTADGHTFDGDYTAAGDLSGWKIGPGSAPEAGIYSLKVFGDIGGTTSLAIPALEWAADPNGDGDPADHVDVVNMSLGSDFSAADDPENLFVDSLAELGVLTVAASGNGGDITDIGGSPGSARSALTVANSVSSTQTYDAVEVTAAPGPALIGLHAAQSSANYSGTSDVTAPVQYIGDVTGCTSLASSSAQITGKIVWLSWSDDDATRPCGSAVRWNNAQNAGAVGVLIGTGLPVFTAGIAGNAGIPGAQLTAAATTALLPAIQAGGVVAHIGPSLAHSAFVTDPSLADTVNSSSSRGVHGSLGVVKPDVAAPGTLISSVAAGSGTGTVTYSGTSMATPHVAGIAALVAQTHPDWAPADIKAAIMNTATHDVFSGVGQTGPAYGPVRVGAGRVDALDATQDQVVAYDAAARDLVSVTFGVVPVGATTVVQTRNVAVRNEGGTARTFTTSFAGSTTAGGATIAVSPAQVTVPAGGTAEVTVTLTVDPATLARDIDPTHAATYDLGGDVPRDYVTSVSGRLILTPAVGPELRVPVQAAPKPYSELSTQPVTFASGATSAPLVGTGRGITTGGWSSLQAPFVLAATSPELATGGPSSAASAVRAADIAAVGWASTAPELAAAGLDPTDGVLGLGIATYGEWSTLGGAVTPVIDTDIDGDGIYDLETYVWKLTDLDLTVVDTYALSHSDSGYVLGEELEVSMANGLSAARDTSVFDSNVLVVPFTMSAVGITANDTPTFSVAMSSPYAQAPSGIVDEVAPFTTTPFDPPVWFESTPGATADTVENTVWYSDQPATPLVVHRSATTSTATLLVLHAQNQMAARAQVVDLSVTAPKKTSRTYAVAPHTVREGVPVPVSAVIRSRGASPTGTVTISDGAQVLATTSVAALRSSGFALALVTKLSVGTHHLTVAYGGNATVEASSADLTVRVTAGRK